MGLSMSTSTGCGEDESPRATVNWTVVSGRDGVRCAAQEWKPEQRAREMLQEHYWPTL